jgi:hypothetical protein
VYIDRGRYFPPNVTLSRVVLELCAANGTRAGPDFWELADARETPTHPEYGVRPCPLCWLVGGVVSIDLY